MSLPAAPARDPLRFVVPATTPQVGRLLRFHLDLADRPLVLPGQRVDAGQPLIEHFRDQEAVEIPTTAAVVGMRPGEPLDSVPLPSSGRLGRRTSLGNHRARVLEHGRDGTTRLAAGNGSSMIIAPASGIIEAVTPGRVDLRAEGLAIGASVGWGRPAIGHIAIVADAPDAEVPASRIDVSAAGAILVAGARLDIEAMTRARAIGVVGIITGAVASRHLRQLGSSEARQQAALHAAAPFGLLALDGYGRLPIPAYLWDLLLAAQGRPAGIHPDARCMIIGGDPAPLLAAAARPAGTVRVTCGEHRDREGRLVGLAGARRWPGGAYAPGGFVEVMSTTGSVERLCLPLPLLERFG
jgi:hypothetical protein